MSQLMIFAIDVVAICILTFGMYFPRHRRRDLVVAYLGVNIGVLAVAGALASSTVGAGLGLGLFGVLSIIRLRSTELDQGEVAYYFASLALGLLGGLGSGLGWYCVALMALVLSAVYIGDHPRMMRGYHQQVVVLDTAIADELELKARLEELLNAKVHRATIQRLDLVNDTTIVDVRYKASVEPRRRSRASSNAQASTFVSVGAGMSTGAGSRP